MPKILKSHGSLIAEQTFKPSPLNGCRIPMRNEVTELDENGNLIKKVTIKFEEYDSSITSDDFDLSNIIASGSVGLLRPVAPIAPGAITATDMLSSGLDSLDPSQIVEPLNN